MCASCTCVQELVRGRETSEIAVCPSTVNALKHRAHCPLHCSLTTSRGFPAFSDEIFAFLTRLTASVVHGRCVHITFSKVDVTEEQKAMS